MLAAAGFSAEVSERVVAPQKASTKLLYQGRWKMFQSWCQDLHIDPFQVTIPQVADYLLFLFSDRKLSPRSVEGHRTAIAHTLKFVSSVDIGKDARLTALIHSFFKERPKPLNATPPWDLSIVLKVLSQAPFEPIDNPDKVSLKLLTWKTVFLVLLASGCRRCEVHALQFKKIQRDDKWKWVTLFPLESFVSKTQLRTSGASVLQPVHLKALSTVVPPDLQQDRALCPVRALKAYLARTSHLRQDRKLLFVSLQEGHVGDIHPNTITGWVRKLIRFAYDTLDDNSARLLGTSVHAVRGMAATLAFKGSAPLEEILQACSWKSHNTFTSFYLKEVSGLSQDVLTLGPLVVAQHIVSGK